MHFPYFLITSLNACWPIATKLYMVIAGYDIIGKVIENVKNKIIHN